MTRNQPKHHCIPHHSADTVEPNQSHRCRFSIGKLRNHLVWIIRIMTSCSLPEHPSRPFSDQTLCEHSGGPLNRLWGVIRNWSIGNAHQSLAYLVKRHGKSAIDVMAVENCMDINTNDVYKVLIPAIPSLQDQKSFHTAVSETLRLLLLLTAALFIV